MKTIPEEQQATPAPPPAALSIRMNNSNRSNNSRTEVGNFTIADGGTDGGVTLYDTHGYWSNMSLATFKALIDFFIAHYRFRRERFRPIGWRLVPLDTEREPIEVREGQSVTFVGDAFVIRNVDGEAIGPAYSALDWSVEPIVT